MPQCHCITNIGCAGMECVAPQAWHAKEVPPIHSKPAPWALAEETRCSLRWRGEPMPWASWYAMPMSRKRWGKPAGLHPPQSVWHTSVWIRNTHQPTHRSKRRGSSHPPSLSHCAMTMNHRCDRPSAGAVQPGTGSVGLAEASPGQAEAGARGSGFSGGAARRAAALHMYSCR